MKDNKIVSPSLPGFYKSVFKVWNLLKKATGGLPSLAAAGACPVWDLFRSPPLGTSHPVQSAAGCRGLHAGPGGGASRAWTRRIKKSQLLNFVLGQAKMAVYITRKRKVEQDIHIEPLPVSVNMIRSRLLIDFSFYKAASDLDSFNDLWCFQDVLCSVTSHELVCADYFV